MRPPAQRCMHRWVLRVGQGACGPRRQSLVALRAVAPSRGDPPLTGSCAFARPRRCLQAAVPPSQTWRLHAGISKGSEKKPF
jgi:hypothetical protein